MATFGRKNFMQHVLFEVHDVAKQCVVVVFDELSCHEPSVGCKPARTPQ